MKQRWQCCYLMHQSCPWMRNCNFESRLCWKEIQSDILTEKQTANRRLPQQRSANSIKMTTVPGKAMYSPNKRTFDVKMTFRLYRISCFFRYVTNRTMSGFFLVFVCPVLRWAAPPRARRLLCRHCHREQKKAEKWRTSGKSVLSLCPAVSTVRGKRRSKGSFSSSSAYLSWTPQELRPTGLSQRMERSNSKYVTEQARCPANAFTLTLGG